MAAQQLQWGGSSLQGLPSRFFPLTHRALWPIPFLCSTSRVAWCILLVDEVMLSLSYICSPQSAGLACVTEWVNAWVSHWVNESEGVSDPFNEWVSECVPHNAVYGHIYITCSHARAQDARADSAKCPITWSSATATVSQQSRVAKRSTGGHGAEEMLSYLLNI